MHAQDYVYVSGGAVDKNCRTVLGEVLHAGKSFAARGTETAWHTSSS